MKNIAITMVLALAGCGNGPSEAEFVQACLRSSQPAQVNQAICECGAREAHSKLEPATYRAMVLDMQGKPQEAEAAVSHLPFEKRAEFAMQQFEILGKCIDEK